MTTTDTSATKQTAEALLERVHEAHRAAVTSRQTLDDTVARARLRGVSWTELGRVLGISRQGAQRRFGRKRAS